MFAEKLTKPARSLERWCRFLLALQLLLIPAVASTDSAAAHTQTNCPDPVVSLHTPEEELTTINVHRSFSAFDTVTSHLEALEAFLLSDHKSQPAPQVIDQQLHCTAIQRVSITPKKETETNQVFLPELALHANHEVLQTVREMEEWIADAFAEHGIDAQPIISPQLIEKYLFQDPVSRLTPFTFSLLLEHQAAQLDQTRNILQEAGSEDFANAFEYWRMNDVQYMQFLGTRTPPRFNLSISLGPYAYGNSSMPEYILEVPTTLGDGMRPEDFALELSAATPLFLQSLPYVQQLQSGVNHSPLRPALVNWQTLNNLRFLQQRANEQGNNQPFYEYVYPPLQQDIDTLEEAIDITRGIHIIKSNGFASTRQEYAGHAYYDLLSYLFTNQVKNAFEDSLPRALAASYSHSQAFGFGLLPRDLAKPEAVKIHEGWQRLELGGFVPSAAEYQRSGMVYSMLDVSNLSAAGRNWVIATMAEMKHVAGQDQLYSTTFEKPDANPIKEIFVERVKNGQVEYWKVVDGVSTTIANDYTHVTFIPVRSVLVLENQDTKKQEAILAESGLVFKFMLEGTATINDVVVSDTQEVLYRLPEMDTDSTE